MEILSEYKWLIAAVAAGIAYLLFVRPRLKNTAAKAKGPTYVCEQCGDRDCHCHQLKEPEN